MLTVLWIVAVLAGLVALAYVNASGRTWGSASAPPRSAWLAHAALALTCCSRVFVVLAIPLAVPHCAAGSSATASSRVYRKVMPPMSQTEREALEAGTVWWDGELFSGRPDWKRLLATPPPSLTAEEQRFLDEETEALCAMTTDWEATQRLRDLPPHVWQFIKDKGFFGMIIPKEYGGLGFSAYAHSQVITKLSTRCGHDRGDGDGAELARPRRAARALRHRRAEAVLPAAARQGPRDSLLRAHQSVRGLGRGRDSRLRVSCAGASTTASACSACR